MKERNYFMKNDIKGMRLPIGGALADLRKEGLIPFHMPGHKRKMAGPFPDAEGKDITEITGYDNLHKPEEIIRESMDQLKSIYGTRESWYLVNGSTVGILASLCAVCRPGDRILMARNCHKAVYNAVRLLRLNPLYIYPSLDPMYGLAGSISPDLVYRILSRYPDIRAVVITSPSYEGVVSDVERIRMVIDRAMPCRRAALIVDEAHGAHFHFHPYFPTSAVCTGADLVIQSTHKTLPAMTQTALLHLCSTAIPPETILDRLSIFESSSPSYILMASAEYGVMYMYNKVENVEKYVDNLSVFRKKCGQLLNIRLISNENDLYFDYDPGKLVFYAEGKGRDIFHRLRSDYGIEAEMAMSSYLVCMTSVMDEEGDYERLFCALTEIDRLLEKEKAEDTVRRIKPDLTTKKQEVCIKAEKIFLPWECEDRPCRKVALCNAAGTVAAREIMIYPPGIPLIVPGEKFPQEMVENITSSLYNGYNVAGVDMNEKGLYELLVLDEDRWNADESE